MKTMKHLLILSVFALSACGIPPKCPEGQVSKQDGLTLINKWGQLAAPKYVCVKP